MLIHCPDCQARFKVSVAAIDHTGQEVSKDSPVTPKVLRAVLEFMRFMGPCRLSVPAVVKAYEDRRRAQNWPRITERALLDSLKRNGATRWRTASVRGWDIPALEPDQEAAPAAPTVLADIEAKAYSEALVDHSGNFAARREEPVPPAVNWRELPIPFQDPK